MSDRILPHTIIKSHGTDLSKYIDDNPFVFEAGVPVDIDISAACNDPDATVNIGFNPGSGDLSMRWTQTGPANNITKHVTFVPRSVSKGVFLFRAVTDFAGEHGKTTAELDFDYVIVEPAPSKGELSKTLLESQAPEPEPKTQALDPGFVGVKLPSPDPKPVVVESNGDLTITGTLMSQPEEAENPVLGKASFHDEDQNLEPTIAEALTLIGQSLIDIAKRLSTMGASGTLSETDPS